MYFDSDFILLSASGHKCLSTDQLNSPDLDDSLTWDFCKLLLLV